MLAGVLRKTRSSQPVEISRFGKVDGAISSASWHCMQETRWEALKRGITRNVAIFPALDGAPAVDELQRRLDSNRGFRSYSNYSNTYGIAGHTAWKHMHVCSAERHHAAGNMPAAEYSHQSGCKREHDTLPRDGKPHCKTLREYCSR